MRNLHRILIMSALLAPEPSEGGGGGAGGTGADDANKGNETPARTFTQDEVDRIVAARVAKAASAGKSALSASEQAKARVAELEAELEETRGKLAPDDASKAEQAKIARENARLQAELVAARAEKAAADTQLSQLSQAQRTTKIENTMRKALAAGGAHERGLDQAVRLMAAEGAAEVDDDGVTVTINKIPYTGEAAIAKAAAEWLAANPHFAKGSDGGSGGRRPNGGALPVDMDKMTSRQLLHEGLRSNRT